MRTDQEILARIKEVEEDDFFGFQQGDFISYLSFEAAKPYLKEGVDADKWKPADQDAIKEEMCAYMSFALDKVTNHRGLSANRSIDHFRAWLWMLGDNEALAFLNDEENYTNYGAPMLKHICEKYDIPFPADAGINKMAAGGPCRVDCMEGCGT